MNKLKFILFCIPILIFYGCAEKNVLFVTKTSLGIDADTKPGNLSVAYDRTEGYIGPRYDSGAIPPVLASIQSDAGIFTAKIRQFYATGDAAGNLVKTEKPACAKELTGEKKPMFFGTTTTVGLKLGFTGELPDSFTFGLKRKEFSYIPLGTKKSGEATVDVYPSVVASLGNNTQAQSVKTAGMSNDQLFATGCAAELLAERDDVREIFINRAKDSFKEYYEAVHEQQQEAAGVLRCYAGVKEDDLPEVWKDAEHLNLFYDKNVLDQLMKLYNSKQKDDLRTANKRYASDIFISEGSTPTRIELLRVHRKLVCEMAKKP